MLHDFALIYCDLDVVSRILYTIRSFLICMVRAWFQFKSFQLQNVLNFKISSVKIYCHAIDSCNVMSFFFKRFSRILSLFTILALSLATKIYRIPRFRARFTNSLLRAFDL